MRKINIEGMSCQHCVGAVTKALENLGLQDVTVDLEEKTASFQNHPEVTTDLIKKVLADEGFTLKE